MADDDPGRGELWVRCVCGWELSGPVESVVTATREHGERVHNMTATREQILAMAVAVPDRPDPSPAEGGGKP